MLFLPGNFNANAFAQTIKHVFTEFLIGFRQASVLQHLNLQVIKPECPFLLSNHDLAFIDVYGNFSSINCGSVERLVLNSNAQQT